MVGCIKEYLGSGHRIRLKCDLRTWSIHRELLSLLYGQHLLVSTSKGSSKVGCGVHGERHLFHYRAAKIHKLSVQKIKGTRCGEVEGRKNILMATRGNKAYNMNQRL